jgi:hypothetical protein
MSRHFKVAYIYILSFDLSYLPILLLFLLLENIRIRHIWSLVWLYSMTNCKKPVLSYIHILLKLFIHCCWYPLMGCLNSLFYFLLYNTFIRSGLYFVHMYMYRLSTLMRPLAIVLFLFLIFARAHDTIVYEREREGRIIPHKFRSGYTISCTIVIRWLLVVSWGYQSTIKCY